MSGRVKIASPNFEHSSWPEGAKRYPQVLSTNIVGGIIFGVVRCLSSLSSLGQVVQEFEIGGHGRWLSFICEGLEMKVRGQVFYVGKKSWGRHTMRDGNQRERSSDGRERGEVNFLLLNN